MIIPIQPALLSLFTPSSLVLFSEGLNPAIPKAINLTIFVLVLYYLLRKPSREFFSNRLRQVRATLDEAARQKENAVKRLAEINARLERMDAEVVEIKSEADRESATEQNRLEASVKADAERLRVVAQREIEAAKQSALAELREFTAERSVELAEQMIKRELTPEDDRRLVEAGAEFERGKR